MKVHNLLCSGPKMRTLLDDSKTQMRWPIMLPHYNNPLGAWEPSTIGGGSTIFSDGTPAAERPCISHTRTGETPTFPYGWISDLILLHRDGRTPNIPVSTLEILDVRVERLQSISEADALAEGVKVAEKFLFTKYSKKHRPAAAAYARQWKTTCGADSWDANPWVWAVEFRRLL